LTAKGGRKAAASRFPVGILVPAFSVHTFAPGDESFTWLHRWEQGWERLRSHLCPRVLV